MVKILIAEDSITDSKYIESILEDKGYELYFAKDGEEDENLINSNNFDLILLDVVMPKKNGLQLCREIKKSEKIKNIPVVLITSKKEEADKYWGKMHGADEHIPKPFESIDLLAVVKKWLKR